MKDTLEKIESFHGHLGPYVVIGYRMGLIANEKLGKDPFSKTAIVSTGNTPPISCMIDGIQLSSGCTLGKGNIMVSNENAAKAVFSDKIGKKITIHLKDEVKNDIDTYVTEENIESYSRKIFEKSDSELFNLIL